MADRNVADVLEELRAKGVDERTLSALRLAFETAAIKIARDWRDVFIEALYASLSAALVARISLEEWLPEAAKVIRAYGGEKNPGGPVTSAEAPSFLSWFAALVFGQATINALQQGRYSDMFFTPAAEEFPYWMFVTAEDDKVCAICRPLDGRVFAKSDASARRFLPPLHFNCRCHVIDLSVDDVRSGGYDVVPGISVPVIPDFNEDPTQSMPIVLKGPVLPPEPDDNVFILKLRPVSAPVPAPPTTRRKAAERETA